MTNESTAFVIETGDSIKGKDAIDMIVQLLNKATIYTLLKDSNDETNIKSNNTNNSFITSDHYRLSQFHRIIINIGVARKLIASYS